MNILDLLLPRETKFYKFMDQQVGFLSTSTTTFQDLVVNIKNLNEDQIREKLAKIKDCENRGDQVEHQILQTLVVTFVTPFDREDINSLAMSMDRALDILNSISRKIEMYNIRDVPANICKFADIIVRITRQMGISVDQLRKRQNVDNAVKNMHELEHEADDLFHESMAQLFSNKNDPVYIVKFKEFYEHLESVVDAIDYVGKSVKGIGVKHK